MIHFYPVFYFGKINKQFSHYQNQYLPLLISRNKKTQKTFLFNLKTSVRTNITMLKVYKIGQKQSKLLKKDLEFIKCIASVLLAPREKLIAVSLIVRVLWSSHAG